MFDALIDLGRSRANRSGIIIRYFTGRRASVQRLIPFPRGLTLLGSAMLLGAVTPTSPGERPLEPRSYATHHGSVHGGMAALSSCETDGATRINAAFRRWSNVVRNRESLSRIDIERRAESIIADIFAIEAMSEEILGSRWQREREYERQHFRDALVRALRDIFLPYFEAQDELPHLRPSAEEWVVDEGSVRARYWLVGSEASDWFNFRLTGADDTCRIIDVWKGDQSVIGYLRRPVQRNLERYSFPYMIATLGAYDSVILDNFEDDVVGSLPHRWSWREKDDDKNKPYRVQVENDNQYLEATDEGESVILLQEVRWNLDEFPYISFRIRVNRIPEGGDERDDRKVDSAAGVYVTLKMKFFGKIPESIKYVWSSTLPVGAAVRRSGVGRPWQVVFGSGDDGLGEWRTYVFDLRQAYEDTFGGDAPSRSVGLGVLSDANSLDSEAYADYDDFRALRTAPRGVSSGVVEIMPPIGK